jgi:DNA topoisomerase-1
MERWIERKGSKRAGFRYVLEGKPVRDLRALTRIDALRIPPAWRDVHIAHSPRASVQAWGFDARGRKQYRYHERAVQSRELRKYHRMRYLAKSLPLVRRMLVAESERPGMSSDTACAIALRLISENLFRPGSERYERENRTHGMTTMRKKHVRVEERRAVFEYVGKSKKQQRQVVTDPELLKLVRRLVATPGQRLFRYRDGGDWRDLGAPRLTDFVHRRIGPFAVKDFRTWGGTLRAAIVLAELGPARSESEARRNVALAMRVVASELGNTPAICRSSYVHPIVVARYLDEGETIAIRSALQRKTGVLAHSPEERALIAFLDRHFRERRRPGRRPQMARAA